MKLETPLFLEHTFPIPAFTTTCCYPILSSQPGAVKTVGARVCCETAVVRDEHLSVSSICLLKHWLWHFFRQNTREMTPERQNIIAFLRECFASVTCLSETISFGGSDENHIVLELFIVSASPSTGSSMGSLILPTASPLLSGAWYAHAE